MTETWTLDCGCIITRKGGRVIIDWRPCTKEGIYKVLEDPSVFPDSGIEIALRLESVGRAARTVSND